MSQYYGTLHFYHYLPNVYLYLTVLESSWDFQAPIGMCWQYPGSTTPIGWPTPGGLTFYYRFVQGTSTVGGALTGNVIYSGSFTPYTESDFYIGVINYATLNVYCSPNATFTFDSVNMGSTPKTITNVIPRDAVYSWSLDKPGYFSKSGVIQINNGGTTYTINETTSPIPGTIYFNTGSVSDVTSTVNGVGSTTNGSMVVNPGTYTVTFSKTGYTSTCGTVTVTVYSGVSVTASCTLTPNPGTITCNALPGATVWLDGVSKGVVTFLTGVPAGTHTVKYVKSLYYDCINSSVVVPPGGSVVATCTPILIPTTGTITCSPTPIGSNVSLDGGASLGAATSITNVTPGNHTVTYSKTGYNSCSVTVYVTAGQSVIAACTLTPQCTSGQYQCNGTDLQQCMGGTWISTPDATKMCTSNGAILSFGNIILNPPSPTANTSFSVKMTVTNYSGIASDLISTYGLYINDVRVDDVYITPVPAGGSVDMIYGDYNSGTGTLTVCIK